MATRKYEKKRRAEHQADTRQRIVEAMVALHAEVGPARTTISAIAERAGVERLTVYRHFADEAAMFQACSAHFASVVVPPDPSAWAHISEPAERFRAALLVFYAYFRDGEDMLTHVNRDLPHLPALGVVMAPWDSLVAAVRDDVVDRWRPADAARARLTVAVSHALRFDTWRSLTRVEGLTDADAADLMVALAEATASGRSA